VSRIADLVTLTAPGGNVRIAPGVGGAIASYEWQGRDVLRRTSDAALADGKVRQFACYPLLPFSNRIADATLFWDGKPHVLRRYIDEERHAIHGNGWQRSWRVQSRNASSAVLVLDHDAQDERRVEWPFPYSAVHSVSLAADALTLQLDIENSGTAPFPFGLGWHPYFPRNERTELAFSAGGVWLTQETQLPTDVGTADAFGDFRDLRRIGTAAIDNCFFDWTPPARVAWPDRAMAIAIDADPACDRLVVFIPPGKDFLALEPVTHMTDAFNRAAETTTAVDAATGRRVLAPGERFSCTMRISASQIVPR